MGVALALVATAPGSTAATTFTDPTGDSGGAPDITNVVVDNDATGTITMTVTTANQADLATDARVDIIFDTDRNPATGSPSGGDYRVLMSLKAPGLHAGKLFSVRVRVSTTATAVRVRCVVKVSGKALRVVGSYARATHIASCTGRAPVATAGKRLAGTMTVTISGDRDSKTFSFVIRV